MGYMDNMEIGMVMMSLENMKNTKIRKWQGEGYEINEESGESGTYDTKKKTIKTIEHM